MTVSDGLFYILTHTHLSAGVSYYIIFPIEKAHPFRQAFSASKVSKG